MTKPDRPPVCVIGLGQIGGSILRAAAAAGRAAFGHDSSQQIVSTASAAGFQVFEDLGAVFERAERAAALIVVAVPLTAVEAVFAQIAEFGGACVVTDVSSVKGPVLGQAVAAGLRARFVGGHPMAGTAQSGWAAADPGLFRDAVWAVSVDEDVSREGFAAVARLALDLGALVVPARSVEHDRAAARISHLPHLLAAALAVTGAQGGALALGLAAGSFRDGTRVIGSDPALVEAMCANNAPALALALDEALDVLGGVREELLSRGSARELVQSGHAARASWDQLAARRPVITAVDPQDPDWRQKLADAGRQGGVLRSW